MKHDVSDAVNTRSLTQGSQAEYLILQRIKAFEDEFKHGVEVVRAWRGYKDIGVTVKNVKIL